MKGRRGLMGGQEVIVPDVGEGQYGQAYADLFTAYYQGLAFSGGSNRQAFIKSATANPAAANFARLARTDEIHWRDAGDTADYALGVDSNNRQTWRGANISYAPTVIAHCTSGMTINTTNTTIIWNVATVNSGTMLNTSTGVVTFPLAGVYLVNYRVLLNGTPATVNPLLAFLLINGATTPISSSYGDSTGGKLASPQAWATGLIRVAAVNDTLEVQARNTTATALTTTAHQVSLGLRWIRA